MAALPENKEKAGKDAKFETTFQPKKSAVNFGTLKKESAKPPKKKKKRGKRVLVLLLVLLLLLAGIAAALYFTGYLQPVLELVGLAEPKQEEVTLEERKAYLDILEASLIDREAALGRREERLAQWEKELTAAAQQENPLTFRDRVKELSEEQVEDFKRLGLIYTNMSAEQAAQTLTEMHSLTEVALIVYYMRPASAALVLEQMGAELAANLTQMILS